MLNNKKIVVIMPAFNAEKTLRKTYSEIPFDLVDEVILTDDASTDSTVSIASELNIFVLKHSKNLGYGANQKTCYREALHHGADIVVMLHPDYQYSPKLIRAIVAMLDSDHYDMVIASRILGGQALDGGMPLYKYFFNRLLTFFENLLLQQKVSEYHSGYRGFKKSILISIPFENCSDDFLFDNQILAQTFFYKFKVGEISCPTKYTSESSSIGFFRSLIYGLGVIKTACEYRLHKSNIFQSKLFLSKLNPSK